jgi:hypothetical protein
MNAAGSQKTNASGFLIMRNGSSVPGIKGKIVIMGKTGPILSYAIPVQDGP